MDQWWIWYGLLWCIISWFELCKICGFIIDEPIEYNDVTLLDLSVIYKNNNYGVRTNIGRWISISLVRDFCDEVESGDNGEVVLGVWSEVGSRYFICVKIW